jgi:hypothetical protein
MELDSRAMAFGIGRKATDEELRTYLSKGLDETSIPLEEARRRYQSRKHKKSIATDIQSLNLTR